MGSHLPSSRSRSPQRGFTLLGLLLVLVILVVAASATRQTQARLQRRAAEQELLAIGAEFSAALASYAAATPPDQPTAPAALEELLSDSRFQMPRRHLRRIYADPMTGEARWGMVVALDSRRIVAVHSLSGQTPLKRANFAAPFQHFEGALHYHDWFFAAPDKMVPPAAAS